MVFIGLTEDDLIALENALLNDPKLGDVIRGTGGLRKTRIPILDTGKRSGGRVVYIDIEVRESVFLINVYAKNEKTDLTEKEKNILAQLVRILKEE